ncbi:histidine kinase [Paenibacillus sp. HWE-109]|uniref:cache domain-containing sensor histidine kinase n=1 Tax=Paenibacillus sp. HWE-109 TaxID=1306526 RepID=UPI001EDF5990|nr:sensor histidine kinase [Paenibacillus sp. HWE-109]UKS27108.1 histidine kinase [Paenibacillus sp. HWE-109]
MAIRFPASSGHSGLLSRLSLPIFVLIVTFIALFATAASYILIRVQNDHTLKMAEQSTKFVYRNIEYQFNTMNNVAAFLMSNQSIENLLMSTYQQPFEAVGDFYTLEANLQNLSLLSLLNDFGSGNVVQQSYVVSVALEPGSGLFAMATEHFSPITGIYKNTDLQDQKWFQSLSRGERQNVWWSQKTDANAAMIYSARKKTSLKDGRSVGTVIIGADTGSIRGIFDNARLDEGFHLLLDESDRVMYSERYDFLEDVGGLSYVRALEGAKGSIITKIDGENHRVMFETLDNGWKLLAVVPESHFSRYTLAISLIGAATAAAALLIAGFWLRRIVIRVTVPITRLVTAIQRPEVVEFKEPLPAQNTGIYEVDELNQKFAAMLVTIHGLIEKSFTEEIERRQLQLELLHAQINPHFLYNTLDLINCRAIMTGDQETSLIVRSLANVFRYGLNRGKTWISLEEEMKQVEAYLHIQMMMMDDLRIEIKIPDELLHASIVHLILQPLAENAIIHGFSDRKQGCRIVISARLEREGLILRVDDNGRGCDADRMNGMLRQQLARGNGDSSEAGTGYGTLNVHRRIQLHDGDMYGLRYVRIGEGEGTRVEVVLPYQGKQPTGRKDVADV